MDRLSGIFGFDTITIGGKQYSANQVIDKSITASRDTDLYSRPGGNVVGKVKAGNVIGKVYSYILPSRAADGRGWLQFETTYNNFFFVPDEATSPKLLTTQGSKTLEQEQKEKEAAEAKAKDPITYYAKKLIVPALLIVGGIYMLTQFGKTAIEKKLSQ